MRSGDRESHGNARKHSQKAHEVEMLRLMRDAVGKRVGDAAIAARIMTQIDDGGLSVLASNPLMLGLIAHTLADSSDGRVVDTASLATQTAVTTRALDGALHPTPLAEARLHRHRAVLAAAASDRRC